MIFIGLIFQGRAGASGPLAESGGSLWPCAWVPNLGDGMNKHGSVLQMAHAQPFKPVCGVPRVMNPDDSLDPLGEFGEVSRRQIMIMS
jgi:hypothetical protein